MKNPSSTRAETPRGSPFPPDALAEAQDRVLRWFDGNARVLPWRPPDPLALPAAADRLAAGGEPAARSPYAVWISEVMLQQTQVATVIPYFRKWMALFPDPVALARAPEETVLRAWAGLGYYSRARNLHKAARALVERGAYPDDAEGWKSLPGIGDYTAGAVTSLSFDRPSPLVDGNVVRVFSRLMGLEFLPGDGVAARKAYWDRAARWADHRRAGAVNEGLMELGALVCVPSSPRCGECPLEGLCAARREGRENELPPVKKRAAIEGVRGVAVRATLGKKVLTERRGAGAFLAGHEMFPLFLGDEAGEWRSAFQARFPGLRITRAAVAARVRHSIMSKRYDLEIWDCVVDAGGVAGVAAAWTRAAAVEARLTNALARKIWKAPRSADS